MNELRRAWFPAVVLAVTVIELALIGSMMMSGSPAASTLARDTVYATVMIVCNGVVGLCLLAGALRHHVLVFQVKGAGHALDASHRAVLVRHCRCCPRIEVRDRKRRYHFLPRIVFRAQH